MGSPDDLESSLVDLSECTLDEVCHRYHRDHGGALRRFMEALTDPERSHAGFNSSF